MMAKNIFFQYLEWQYIDATKNILRGWGNYLRFNMNYWSVSTLLKTFFSHWRRYQYSYGRGLNIKRFFEVFTFNMISRVIGAVVRSIFIILGILTEIFVALAGAIICLGWLALPAFIISCIIFGLKVLF